MQVQIYIYFFKIKAFCEKKYLLIESEWIKNYGNNNCSKYNC
ncbi:hypothetical protein CCYN2B_100034 [Capnocytophaga cynodegmi]|uniref:Uncharacterized protein n=1 Tax=Capnocytophaga cynodegmi TaxID=28189 RepID=A0A0B7H1K9_9FLAO|nr:hypothetical protein CCYN2B_100034 [Capnocytophaga cynodegmi]